MELVDVSYQLDSEDISCDDEDEVWSEFTSKKASSVTAPEFLELDTDGIFRGQLVHENSEKLYFAA